MKKFFLLCLVLCFSTLLNGCVLFYGYTAPVQQGNVISESKVNLIQNGMSASQVAAILGSPVYTNTFSDNRWDYVYTYKRGYRPMHERVVIISFSNGVVTNIQRNLAPLPQHYYPAVI